ESNALANAVPGAMLDFATSTVSKVYGFFASSLAFSVYFQTKTPARAAKTTAAIAVRTLQLRTRCPLARVPPGPASRLLPGRPYVTCFPIRRTLPGGHSLPYPPNQDKVQNAFRRQQTAPIATERAIPGQIFRSECDKRHFGNRSHTDNRQPRRDLNRMTYAG